jgi:hypothetical protein
MVAAQVNERYIAQSAVRSMIAATIRANNIETEKAVGEALRVVIGELKREAEARCAALEAQINRLQSAVEQFRYVGQWEQKPYRAGNFVTFASGIWHANNDTRERPGVNGDWSVAVPKGRDGKDFTPPPPASPGGPRSVRTAR